MPPLSFGGAALCACVAMAAGNAAASGFDIGPTRALLSPTSKVQTLRLRNPGDIAVGFEVTIKRWQMDAGGEWKLLDLSGPSDLVVHPLSFQVEPGKTQLWRVGLARTPTGNEQAYRLLVRQLPSKKVAGATSRMGVLTQLSLPIFISDGSAKPQPSLAVGAIENGRWRYVLRSGDNGHLDPAKVSLRLFDAGDQLLSTQALMHDYVLAGASLPVEAKLDPKACRNAVRFEIVAASPLASHKGALAPGPRACAP